MDWRRRPPRIPVIRVGFWFTYNLKFNLKSHSLSDMAAAMVQHRRDSALGTIAHLCSLGTGLKALPCGS